MSGKYPNPILHQKSSGRLLRAWFCAEKQWPWLWVSTVTKQSTGTHLCWSSHLPRTLQCPTGSCAQPGHVFKASGCWDPNPPFLFTFPIAVGLTTRNASYCRSFVVGRVYGRALVCPSGIRPAVAFVRLCRCPPSLLGFVGVCMHVLCLIETGSQNSTLHLSGIRNQTCLMRGAI